MPTTTICIDPDEKNVAVLDDLNGRRPSEIAAVLRGALGFITEAYGSDRGWTVAFPMMTTTPPNTTGEETQVNS